MKQKQNLTDQMEPISDILTYGLLDFMRCTGWGRHAVKLARTLGLRTVKVGGRIFIRGKDFSDFLSKLDEVNE